MISALLYRWSTAAQLISVLMIALFFLTLARSIKRAEVRAWTIAWGWNFAALVVTVLYWFSRLDGLDAAMRASFFGSKMAYALMLVAGARAMRRPGEVWMRQRTLVLAVIAVSAFGAFGLSTIDGLGVAVQLPIGMLFTWCGLTLLGDAGATASWLAYGFLTRGVLALIEASAYAADMAPAGIMSAVTTGYIQMFLGAHSSLDLAAEWMLALGGVLAVTNRTQSEVESANANLLAAQEQLRNIADRDPLTGLANRRALPDTFRAVFDTGASLVFCDLDGFKGINDTFGHTVGDACLLRFAAAFRASFRPEDVIVRYAGDEFVAVCAEMDVSIAQSRINGLRDRLLADPDSCNIQFSAGIVELQRHESADDALQAADKAMYVDKKVRHLERAQRPSLSQRMSGAVTR